MDLLSTIQQFESMNDPLEIKDSLEAALSVVDLTENWDAKELKLATLLSQPKEPEQIEFLQNQVLRSATRILSAEKDLEDTQTEFSENDKKLRGIQVEIARQKEMVSTMKCERSKEEMKALAEFMEAINKARRDYREAKRVFSDKREAKLQLLAAAEKRLETLRISHEELGRIYAKKSSELEKKLEKERVLYTLSLECLAKAQEDAEMLKASIEDDTCSSTSAESASIFSF
jgi:hypothetical protein